ncbi:MAG: glycosyltransferase, partial [Chlamydiae bacterium]|nr:glycosyltransferase [Chlamydiota bacterium]
MKKRALSVIIPNYNHAPFLGETIDSVLNQDFDDFEVLVGDDASTDESRAVIESFGDRIRPFYFKKNRGYFATVTDLFKEVQGEFVQIFSSDDLYLPGYLSGCMKLMQEEKLKLVCSDISYFSEKGSRETNLYPSEKPIAFHKEQIVSTFRKSGFWVPGVACITEVETLKKYGLPNPKLENISDWFLFQKIALLEGIGYLPQVGIAMRECEDSYTSKVKKDRKRR